MASVRSVFTVLGAYLPTVENWIDVKWLLALFELSKIGIEFHEFQTWAREVAGETPSTEEQKSSKKPRLENFKVGDRVWDLLGGKLPTRENWLDDHWLQALFKLSSKGVQFGAFRSWSQAVASWMSITRGVVEILPSLLLGEEALKFKSLELVRYVGGLDRSRFYERKYLEDIKAHLEKHRLLYWKRLDVTITIQARLGERGVPQRVRELYDSNPFVHGSFCFVVEAGSSCKPWVMRCGNSISVHGIKKAARMTAIIKEHIDPCFDPDGDSPAPTPYLNNRKRKRMQSVNRAIPTEDKKRVCVPNVN